ncbi:MAG: DUF563 domain-containing protein [Rhodobacteraceae bacterium]|nr:DUF563 domain-containing protein [Paracoccaceae bacterium]
MSNTNYIAHIERLIAAGDFTGAEDVCVQNADRERDNPVFWKVRGDIALMAGRWKDAEGHYRWTIMLAPNSAPAWLGIARAQVSGGKANIADTAAKTALALGLAEENAIAAYEIVANAHFARGETQDGRDVLAHFAPVYRTKIAAEKRPATEVLRSALPAALCAGDIALLKTALEMMYPHAGRIAHMTIAPIAPMQEWCKDAGVQCRVIDQAHEIELAPTTPYSRADSYTTDPILFASIPGGQWVSGWDFAIGSDGTVIEDSGYMDIKHVFNHAPHVYFPSAKLVGHRSSAQIINVDEDVLWVSAPMHNHIGHWLIDFLPRLIGRALAGNPRLKVVVPETLTGAKFTETLAMAGVADADIIRCRHDAHYRFRSLNVYRAGHSMPPHPAHVKYVRDLLRPEPVPSSPGGRAKRVYFARTGIDSRRVINEQDFHRVLDDHGFVTIDLATHSVAEQRDLLAEAEILVGAIGTDLLGMYFVPAGSTVIAMQWEKSWVIDPVIPQTCAMLGLKHQFLICAKSGRSRNARSHMDFDLEVDCAELDRRLREIETNRAL